MTVAEIDGLLYMPNHPRSRLERALRIPALSSGWRGSFQALLNDQGIGSASAGHAGISQVSGTPLAWSGFRSLRVSRKVPENHNVISLVLEATNGQALIKPLPGQFIVLRLQPEAHAPALMRSYSLSDEPSPEHYRVSVKREAHGAAGTYIHDRLLVGDILDASAPRGNFTLGTSELPVVFLSAGVGATPVLAMLHALAAEASRREVWWLYGARDSSEHPFAEEARALIKNLFNGHSHIRYSSVELAEGPGAHFDARGRLDMAVLRDLGLPRNADFYICGPPAFMRDLTGGLTGSGIPQAQIHTESFGSGPSITPGIAEVATSAAASTGWASWCRTAGLIRAERFEC